VFLGFYFLQNKRSKKSLQKVQIHVFVTNFQAKLLPKRPQFLTKKKNN